MTLKKFEIGKARLGKPYSQQPGRKMGRGAGHIVPGASKQIIEHNSSEYRQKRRAEQELKGYAQGTLVVPSESYALVYMNEITPQISDGKYENEVGNWQWYNNLKIKIDPSVTEPKVVYTKAGKRPSKHLTFDDCVEYMEAKKAGLTDEELPEVVRGLQRAINMKPKTPVEKLEEAQKETPVDIDADRIAIVGKDPYAREGQDPTKISDTHHFENLSLAKVKQLVDKGYLDLEETQNESPSTREFIEFMVKHPEVTAHGYVVTQRRNDSRVTLEGLEYKGKVSPKLMVDFTKFNKHADEFDVETNYLRSWWD